MRHDVQELETVGNTIRNPGRGGKRQAVHAALVVGNTLTSHYWLNILPMARNPALRHYILEEDLELMAGKLHVYPELVPSFLVFHYGYVVDWFPAPLPPAGGVQDPLALLQAVQKQLEKYQ